MKTKSLLCSFPLRFAAGAFAALLAPALFAQTETPALSKDSVVKHPDRSFLKKAAKAGEEEISISTVAVNRATNPKIKELAQTIVTDHRSIASQLSNLASTKGVDLATKETSAAKWEKKSAEDFDKDYLKEMVEHHVDAVELFTKAGKSDDAQIAAFATQQLPTLQIHLAKANELLKTLH